MLNSQDKKHVSIAAESKAEQVLHDWVEQPQHLMARLLQHDLAPVVQSDAATKKSSFGTLIGRVLGALFGLFQRKAPLVTSGKAML